MDLNFNTIKQEFSALEHNMRTWHFQHLKGIADWQEVKMTAHLQVIYQLTHEALCIHHSVNRECFVPYEPGMEKQQVVKTEVLLKQIDEIRFCWACSGMLSWRPLTGEEKLALIAFEQIYQYVLAVCFNADLWNVCRVTADFLSRF